MKHRWYHCLAFLSSIPVCSLLDFKILSKSWSLQFAHVDVNYNDSLIRRSNQILSQIRTGTSPTMVVATVRKSTRPCVYTLTISTTGIMSSNGLISAPLVIIMATKLISNWRSLSVQPQLILVSTSGFLRVKIRFVLNYNSSAPFLIHFHSISGMKIKNLCNVFNTWWQNRDRKCIFITHKIMHKKWSNDGICLPFFISFFFYF